MLRLLGLACRGLIAAVCLLIGYALYKAVQAEPNPSVRALAIVVGVLAVAAALAVWSRRRGAVAVQIVILPFLAALYLFEWGSVDALDQMLHIEEWARIFKTRLAANQPVIPNVSLGNFLEPEDGFLLPSGERVLPLSGVASMPTIMCREGPRPYAEYVADEHGFNNPQGVWGKPVDVMFIGDSMTYGACLPNRDHFVAQVRARYPATLNLGQGGIGPLIELAMVREFVPRTRPRYVFYMYDENNDLYFPQSNGTADLPKEVRDRILQKYLDDDRFSQRLQDRQPELDALLKVYLNNVVTAALAQRRPWPALVRFLGLPLTREGLRWIDLRKLRAGFGPIAAWAAPETPPRGDDLALFKHILVKTMHVVQEAGARFVFVNIPAQDTLCSGVEHPWKKEVLKFALQTGVDVIDLERDYRRAIKTIGREAVFAVPPCGGHFSEAGYKVIGDRLVQYLDIRERRDGKRPGEGWSVGAVSPASRPATADRAPAVISRVSQVYESYAHVDRPLPAGPAPADDTHGAAILGHAYARRGVGSTLRITVEFTAYSPQGNEIVAAVFVAGERRARHVTAQPVPAGSSASLTLRHSIELTSDSPVPVVVRVGPRRPGIIYINGNDRGPAAPPKRTALNLEEVGFPHDQLVYGGTDVGEQDIPIIRQAAAEQLRSSTAGKGNIVGRAYRAARRWVNRRTAVSVSRFNQKYEPYVRVERVLGSDGGVAVYLEGAAIMGYSFAPKAAGNVVRVTVEVPAWTDRPNSIVAALFVNDAPVTPHVRSQELQPGQPSAAIVDFEIKAPAAQAMSFTVRIGPGRPGAIYLNGNGNGPSPTVPRPTLTIGEYWTFWP